MADTENQQTASAPREPAPIVRNPEGPRHEGPFRVGLLGAGYIAEYHGKALRTLANTRLVAVCDRSAARANACAEAFSIPGVHTSLDAMLASEQLDAVHVLLPAEAHFAAATTIVKAGVAVLLEKPMATSAADCDALAVSARERGVRLGVGHNFLFSPVYERLRDDLRAGVFGPVDHIAITWHKELGQVAAGPFDLWMLREPAHVLIEVGPHPIGHLLDLVGKPDEMRVVASNPILLPTGKTFYRRWQILAYKDRTAIDVSLSFVHGYTEHMIHLRGALCSATVDFERNTYVLHRHQARDIDFDRNAMLRAEASSLRAQAWRTLGNYVASKVSKSASGNPYGHSIARAAQAFYASLGGVLDPRLGPELGRDIVSTCEEIGRQADLASAPVRVQATAAAPTKAGVEPAVLVLGATGFIGREVVRQLVAKGQVARILVRNAGKLPADLAGPLVEVVEGDCAQVADLDRALLGVRGVVHLARSNVKTWADYQKHEIAMTRTVAERTLAAGVGRFVYTGTIDSYYAGARAGTITEQSPLDPQIGRRNLYARAKAASEELLLGMWREQKLPLVIFRPGIVIGRGGSPFHWGIGMWQHGTICHRWGNGQNKLPLVLVKDVASGILAGVERPGIEGEAFNLVGDPLLSADEYLDEIERCAGLKLQRFPTPIHRFYSESMFKWVVKVLVRHPERELPSYRDWESRTQKALFDCSKAKQTLGWQPASDRAALIEQGIAVPVREWLA